MMGFKKQKIPRDLLLDPPRRKRTGWWWIPLLLLLFGLLMYAVDTWASEADAPTAPVMWLGDNQHGHPAVQLSATVDVTVSGLIAAGSLEQTFRNNTTKWQNATYLFPLPDETVIRGMEIHVGDRVIIGKIREKQAAKAAFEKAKAEGRRAALTSHARPNLHTQHIANIAPGEMVTVRLSFVQKASYKGGKFDLRFPLTLTPRYEPRAPIAPVNPTVGESASPAKVSQPDLVETRRLPATGLPATTHTTGKGRPLVSIKVTLDPGLPVTDIRSHYHDIGIASDGNVHRIHLLKGRVPMDRDFRLSWRPEVGHQPGAAVFRETVGGRDYAMLMLLPPPVVSAPHTGPRSMIFVIDTSGSMQGQSIVQATTALKRAIRQLSYRDEFTIIEFDSEYHVLSAFPLPANPANLNMAERFVDNLSADGGTEMYGPLQHALAIPASSGYEKQILFITDGAIGNEHDLLKLVVDKVGDARVHSIAIGSAPNAWFMRNLARLGAGKHTHIGDTAEVSDVMRQLFETLASPVATDITVSWSGSDSVNTYPARLPVLYHDEPLVVTAEAPSLSGNIVISGVTANQPWQQVLPMPEEPEHDGVGTLWARDRIESLETDRLLGADTEAVRQQITSIGLAHRLVTEFTSFVAIEERVARPSSRSPGNQQVANAIPAGHVMLPRTGTSSLLTMGTGLLLLIAGALIYILRRWRTCDF